MKMQVNLLLQHTFVFILKFMLEIALTLAADRSPEVTQSSSVSVENCEFESQFPNVNVTPKSKTAQLLFQNDTFLEFKSHPQEMVLICSTTYPIEWVFNESLVRVHYMYKIRQKVVGKQKG
jgi:hypothetical protein